MPDDPKRDDPEKSDPKKGDPKKSDPKKEQNRAETDASLGAERTAADAAVDRAARIERRVLDDLIESDRDRADQRLLQVRARADKLLALERLASPARDKAVERERRLADITRETEREVADATLDEERHRADVNVAEERKSEPDALGPRDQHREHTDASLGQERRAADALIEETSDELESTKLDRERDQDVLAMVAHDLNSPLTVISLSAQVLMEDSEEPLAREVAEDIARSAARMKRLLADLLEVARIESGAFEIVKEEHDLGELLREVSRSYERVFADRDLTFTVEQAPSAMLAPYDHDRIVQVISNLLSNALKFTPSGGNVRLLTDVTRDHVELQVCDSGPGIPSDELSHVFDRFWQDEQHAGRGQGLGLYICRQIIEAHGGRIWADSVPGEGTTFRFTLPLR